MKKYIHSSANTKISNDIESVLNTHDYSDTNLSFNEIERTGETFVEFSLYGGLNGHGDWSDYFQDLSDFVNDCISDIPTATDVYLVEAENDCVDDVFYAHFRMNFERG